MNLEIFPMEVHRLRHLPIFLLVLIVSSPPSGAVVPADSRPNSGEKVPVVLYYETLCPYCANFIVNGLKNDFDNGFSSIIDLKLVPYGNAKIAAEGTISCQHGPAECFLNTIEACVINAWPSVSEHFPLIYCIEKLVHEGNFTKWESCFSELGLDSKPVTDCYDSGLGKELELQYAAETNALEPPHQYVPWVVVNGKPLYEDYENFESYVCEAYSGTSMPQACSELTHDDNISVKSVQNPRVCYRENSSHLISRLREVTAKAMQWINVAG